MNSRLHGDIQVRTSARGSCSEVEELRAVEPRLMLRANAGEGLIRAMVRTVSCAVEERDRAGDPAGQRPATLSIIGNESKTALDLRVHPGQIEAAANDLC